MTTADRLIAANLNAALDAMTAMTHAHHGFMEACRAGDWAQAEIERVRALVAMEDQMSNFESANRAIEKLKTEW